MYPSLTATEGSTKIASEWAQDQFLRTYTLIPSRSLRTLERRRWCVCVSHNITLRTKLYQSQRTEPQSNMKQLVLHHARVSYKGYHVRTQLATAAFPVYSRYPVLCAYVRAGLPEVISPADPRVADWPLMRSPLPTLLIWFHYLVMCNAGPYLMAKLRPLELRRAMILYNISLIFLSLYMFLEVCSEMPSVFYFMNI